MISTQQLQQATEKYQNRILAAAAILKDDLKDNDLLRLIMKRVACGTLSTTALQQAIYDLGCKPPMNMEINLALKAMSRELLERANQLAKQKAQYLQSERRDG